MSEMLTDLLNNIYTRISQLGKSIKSLQNSIDDLNQTLAVKVESLVDSIKEMANNVKKEGQIQNLIFQEMGQNTVEEVKKLQEKIGLKDMNELLEKLEEIVSASEEALKPETVDILLHEVLLNIKQLKGGEGEIMKEESDENLMDRVDKSLAHQEELTASQNFSSDNSSSENITNKTQTKKKQSLKDMGPPPGSTPPPK